MTVCPFGKNGEPIKSPRNPLRQSLDKVDIDSLSNSNTTDEMSAIFKDYPKRVALHLESLFLEMADRNSACFNDNMTCAYRYVLQKACLNNNTEDAGFDMLRENIRLKLSGEMKKEEFQQFVSEKFGFLQGEHPLKSTIDQYHHNLIRRHNSPCLNQNATEDDYEFGEDLNLYSEPSYGYSYSGGFDDLIFCEFVTCDLGQH